MNNHIDIESFIRGDMRQFELLYNNYVGKIFNYINSFINNQDISKDITQSTFLKLWSSRANLQVDGNIEGYIYSISRNLLFHEMRRVNTFNNYIAKVQDDADIKPEEESQIEECLTRDMIEQQIFKLLLELPESRRNIFLMRWNKGLSNKEIAQELLISEKTVSTQIHRTVKFLKSRIGDIFIVLAIILSIEL